MLFVGPYRYIVDRAGNAAITADFKDGRGEQTIMVPARHVLTFFRFVETCGGIRRSGVDEGVSVDARPISDADLSDFAAATKERKTAKDLPVVKQATGSKKRGH